MDRALASGDDRFVAMSRALQVDIGDALPELQEEDEHGVVELGVSRDEGILSELGEALGPNALQAALARLDQLEQIDLAAVGALALPPEHRARRRSAEHAAIAQAARWKKCAARRAAK